MAEGVALCRAVEASGRIYMLAENYAYTSFSQEMRRLYLSGELGYVTYAEGEYNHPVDNAYRIRLAAGENHWRNWMPATYYCTHALAPLIYITEAKPKKVTCFSILCDEVNKMTMRVNDPGFAMLCRMDNGAVFRIFGLSLPGHSNWYRIHGSRGAMELTRGPGYFGPEQIRVWHEEWGLQPGELTERTYVPQFPEFAELAKQAGHGGGDLFTSYYFTEAIRSGKQPFLDVYKGVAMSSTGILAWRSALEEGAPYDVPDFTSEESRKSFEDDDWSPFPQDSRPGQPPPGIRGYIKPGEEAEKHTRRIWEEMGYRGK